MTSYLVDYLIMTLYYEIRQTLLQNTSAILALLQHATKVYYKLRHFFITKCDSYN